MIWLKHDIHGVKHCYVESEALSDEKNGWMRFEPTLSNPIHHGFLLHGEVRAWANKHAVEIEAALSEDSEQLNDAPKKRGRPFKAE